MRGSQEFEPLNMSEQKYAGFLSQVSSDYTIKKKLSLIKVTKTKKKQAFSFVFVMNKDSHKVKKADSNARSRMHILWTGSKKLLKEQQLIENEYPVDVSIANYEDGFAPEEWNLILPSKKPREISISFLWSF